MSNPLSENRPRGALSDKNELSRDSSLAIKRRHQENVSKIEPDEEPESVASPKIQKLLEKVRSTSDLHFKFETEPSVPSFQIHCGTDESDFFSEFSSSDCGQIVSFSNC